MPQATPYVQRSAAEGRNAKICAIIFALAGVCMFIVLGAIFGALAIQQARKAQAAGLKAGLWFGIGVFDIVVAVVAAFSITIHALS